MTEEPREEVHDSSEEMTLRFRFSTVLVKKEIDTDDHCSGSVPGPIQPHVDEWGQQGVIDPPCTGIDAAVGPGCVTDALVDAQHTPFRHSAPTSAGTTPSQSAITRPSGD